MSTFVLVHGAWHGSWCWDPVAARLRKAGHEILTPTLAGLGERADELTEATGLRDHAEQVAALLNELDDRDVTVVGHSYSGLVVRKAVDRAGVAVRRVVLIDGWAGRDGESLLALAPDRFANGIRSLLDGGDGWRVSPPPPALIGVDDPETASWLSERMTPQPLRSFTEATQLSGSVEATRARRSSASDRAGYR